MCVVVAGGACQFLYTMLDFFYIDFASYIMKSGIHPTYFTKAVITCSCGAVLETGSTVEKMHTEICALCHPFYTGKKKFVDATGRVDRFKKLAEKSEAKQVARRKLSKVKVTAKKSEIKKEAKKEQVVANQA